MIMHRADAKHAFISPQPTYEYVVDRSEGFSRTGYLLPARGTPGVSPDWEGSWDAAVAAAVVAVTWKFMN